MADVRCPMCGKDNPADSTECQYCHARLRPVWDASSDMGQFGPSEEQDDDLPEWLKSLRVPQEEQSAVSEPEPEDLNNLPDWLSSLREQPVDPAYLQSEEIANNLADSSDDDSSDWLQRFLADDNLAEAEAGNVSGVVSEASLQDEANWLTRIDTTPIEDERLQEPVETLDWSTDPAQVTPSAILSDEQDWSLPKETQPPKSSESLLDWLTAVSPDSADRLEQIPDQPAGAAQPGITPEPVEELDEEDELPAWLFQATGDPNPIAAIGAVDLIDSAVETPQGNEPPMSPLEAEAIPISEQLAAEGESFEDLAFELPPETDTAETETPEENVAPFLAVAGAARAG